MARRECSRRHAPAHHRAVHLRHAGRARADGRYHQPGFRRLCREQGAGFYVCEMITSRGLVERNPLTFG